ncbi:MAG: oligosaccharide flippase family protein [Actinomycetota bacterium]|nr:oligosaccharide flippase family protein [Actinomycetota bacterium]
MTSPRRKDSVVRGANEVLVPDKPPVGDEEFVYTPDPLDEQDNSPPNAEPHLIKRLPGADEIKKNTLESVIFRALATPLSIGLTVLMSYSLGTAGVGKYSLAIMTVLLFSRVLSDLGNAATREIGDSEDRVGPVTALALRLCIIFAPIGILAAIALTQAPALFGQDKSVDLDLAILAAVAIAPNIIRQTVAGILVGLSRVRLWNYLQIAPGVLAFVGFLIFVLALDMGVRGAVLAWAIGHTITAVAALVLTSDIWLPHVRARLPTGTTLRLLRLALAMGAVNVIIYVNYRIEFAFIEGMRGTEDVGVYKTATQVAEMLWLVTTAIATATWATVLHEREDRAISIVLRSCLKGLFYMGVGAVGIAVLAPTIVPIAFSDDFKDAVSPLMWLIPGILAYGPVAILAIYISVRHRRPHYALVGPVISIVVTVGLAYMLIDRYGVDGAAMATSAGYIVSALTSWIMFARVAGRSVLGRARVLA